jgi:hypothetical protein
LSTLPEGRTGLPTSRPHQLAPTWRGCFGLVSHGLACRIHVIAPKGRRLRRAGGNLYVVHQQDLDDEQIGWWERVRIVTVGMAIEQCIESGVPTYLIKQALETAARRGAVRSDDLDQLSATLEARNG